MKQHPELCNYTDRARLTNANYNSRVEKFLAKKGCYCCCVIDNFYHITAVKSSENCDDLTCI